MQITQELGERPAQFAYESYFGEVSELSIPVWAGEGERSRFGYCALRHILVED